jgi:hypothetical protein
MAIRRPPKYKYGSLELFSSIGVDSGVVILSADK